MKTRNLLQTIRANARSIAALVCIGLGFYATLAGAAWGDTDAVVALALFLPGILLLTVGVHAVDAAGKAGEPFVRWIDEEAFRTGDND